MGSLFRRLFAASALCLLANAMVTALLPPFIRDELGGDAAACPGQCAVLRRGIAGGLSWGAQGVVLASPGSSSPARLTATAPRRRPPCRRSSRRAVSSCSRLPRA